MVLQDTTYHRLLRVSALTSALVLLFVSGIFSTTTSELTYGTQQYLANAVGMSASVQPNGVNEYTAALTAKEQELASREAALKEREIAVDIDGSTTGSGTAVATYVMAAILFIQLVLIVLNYTLDYLRAKESGTPQSV